MGFKISCSLSFAEVITQHLITELPIEGVEQYKKMCIESDSAPAIHIQPEYLAHRKTIGRDKLIKHHVEACREELQLIKCLTDKRAQQTVQAISLTKSSQYSYQHSSQSTGMIFIARFTNYFLASFVAYYGMSVL